MSTTPPPTSPTIAVLCKLGSIARHVEEAIETGHPLDTLVIRLALEDPEVQEWMAAMDGLALLPVRR